MSEALRSISPSDPDDELGRFAVADATAVDAAVARARAAFPAWRDAGEAFRAAVLRRFRDAARAGEEELARLIAREVGKALWDARAEAALLAAKVDATLGDGMRYVAPIGAGPQAHATHHP
ncbi:MAG: aldehyde dehydrogenase family protein, partial [Myxococcota bacterium]